MNVVVLRGRLSRPPAAKLLPSGDRLVAYEVTTARAGARADTAPVVWFDAPARATDADVGDEVVVVGRIRRRFFRAPGGTASRTEVVAETVIPARHARRAERALQAAVAALETANTPEAPTPTR